MRDITPRVFIIDMVDGIRIEVTDTRIAGATTTDGVIGIALETRVARHKHDTNWCSQ